MVVLVFTCLALERLVINGIGFEQPSSKVDLVVQAQRQLPSETCCDDGRAKLCGILFAFELNRRLKQQGIPVIAHAVHTGAVATDSSRDSVVDAFPRWIPGLRWITGNIFFPLLWRSGQAGSRALLCPALSRAEYIINGGQYLDALCRPFLHDQDPNPTRDLESTFTVPQFLSGEQEIPLTIQIDPVQALLLADLRWSERLWNVSLAFLIASPAKDVMAFAL